MNVNYGNKGKDKVRITTSSDKKSLNKASAKKIQQFAKVINPQKIEIPQRSDS